MTDYHQPSLLWFIRESLTLDLKFLKVVRWSLKKKTIFLLKKYYLLFLYFGGLKKFSLGQSSVNLFGRKIFFDFRFGLAGYQAMLARTQKLLDVAGVDQVQTVVDIGANVGYFSMLIRERFPGAIIYAIEPVHQTLRTLEKNFQSDPRTVLVNKAISNFCGISEMVFDRNYSALSHLVDEKVGKSRKGVVEDVEVQTLDDFVSEYQIDRIDVLKIDVETFEKHVLEGAERALAKTRYLLLEVTIRGNSNYSFSELVDFLYRDGYYNFQLRAFRNFAGKGEGEMPIADFLFENIQR